MCVCVNIFIKKVQKREFVLKMQGITKVSDPVIKTYSNIYGLNEVNVLCLNPLILVTIRPPKTL